MLYKVSLKFSKQYTLSGYYKFLKQYASVDEQLSMRGFNGRIVFNLSERIARMTFIRFPNNFPSLLHMN